MIIIWSTPCLAMFGNINIMKLLKHLSFLCCYRSFQKTKNLFNANLILLTTIESMTFREGKMSNAQHPIPCPIIQKVLVVRKFTMQQTFVNKMKNDQDDRTVF